jgi:hypothetical protein
MLDRIETLAHVTVARACGFAALAIFTLMIGFAGDFQASLKAGGYLSMLVCLILVLCAWNAPRYPYKHTELWLLLTPAERPAAEIAQKLIGGVLREAYLKFALHSAWLGCGMLVTAVLLGLFGRPMA